MKLQLKFLIPLALSLALVSCATAEKNINITTVTVNKGIPIKNRPRPVKLRDTGKFYNVNENNLDSFIERFKNEQGKLNFVAITTDGYKNITLNLLELRRYMRQQRSLLVYYENSINERNEEK